MAVSVPIPAMTDFNSTDIERLTRRYIDNQRYSSSDDVLVFAMQLLSRFESVYHRELGASLKDAFSQIEAGEGIALRGSEEVGAFFDDMITACRETRRTTDRT